MGACAHPALQHLASNLLYNRPTSGESHSPNTRSAWLWEPHPMTPGPVSEAKASFSHSLLTEPIENRFFFFSSPSLLRVKEKTQLAVSFGTDQNQMSSSAQQLGWFPDPVVGQPLSEPAEAHEQVVAWSWQLRRAAHVSCRVRPGHAQVQLGFWLHIPADLQQGMLRLIG